MEFYREEYVNAIKEHTCRICGGVEFYDAVGKDEWFVCAACGAIHDADDTWRNLSIAE